MFVDHSGNGEAVFVNGDGVPHQDFYNVEYSLSMHVSSSKKPSRGGGKVSCYHGGRKETQSETKRRQ
jgi:hypothetical protein